MSSVFTDTKEYSVHRYPSKKEDRDREWLAFRRKGIGGSDAAAILGVSPWTTPYDLWQDKTGARPHEDISGKWAVQRGKALEPVIRKWVRDHHIADGWTVTDGSFKTLISKARPFMLADLDGVIEAPNYRTPGVLEIKTASSERDWIKPDGGLQIPLYYLTQVTHYLAVTGWQWGEVCVSFDRGDPVEIMFTRNDDDVRSLIETERAFWVNNVVRNVPPAPVSELEVKEQYPQADDNDAQVSVDDAEKFDSMAEELDDNKKQIKVLEKRNSDLADRLAVMVGRNKSVHSQFWRASMITRHYKARPEHMVAAVPERFIRSGVQVRPVKVGETK